METRSVDEDFRRYRAEGDPEALARVFDAAAPRLLLLAQHLTRDAARAEDLVQTVFVQAIEGARGFREGRAVMPWLNGILAHRAADLARREALRQGVGAAPDERAEGGLDPAELAAGKELAEQAGDAIDALPEPYRQVLVLRLVHGLEPVEIAHALGRAPGTVRMQLARGLERLRERLPEESAFGLVLLLEPARGLGAVREAVVARATEIGPLLAASSTGTAVVSAGSTTTWSLGGLLAMKVQLLVGATLVLLVSVWALRPESPQVPALATGPAAAPHSAGAASGAEAGATVGGPSVPAGERERLASAAGEDVDASARAQLSVRITRERSGAPAAGVGVYVRPADGSALGVERPADEAGIARFDGLAPGSWHVHLDRVRGAGREVELHGGKPRSVELVLPTGIEVSGTVVDLTGQPVAGATILALNRAHHDFLQTVARSDEQGAFRIDDVAAGTLLGARAPGWQPSDPFDGQVRGDATRKATVEIELGARGNRLAGTVLGPDGTPAAHALVAVTVDEDARESLEGVPVEEPETDPVKAPDSEAFFLRADGAGHFASDEVPGGRAIVLARPADTRSPLVGWAPVLVAPGIAAEVTVHLAPGATVHGTLRDERGDALAGHGVESEWEGTPELGQTEDDMGPLFADRRTTTGEDGAYRLVGLLPGETDLRVRLESGEEALRHEAVLAPGETLAWNPRLALHADLTLELTGPGGEPLAGWRAAASTRHGHVRRSDMGPGTDRAGRTTLRDLPVRPHVVTLHAPTGQEDGELTYTTLPTHVLADVLPDEDVLEVRLGDDALPSASLTGRWVDEAGAPLARTSVKLELEGWDDPSRARTDADGRFRFGPLAPGRYAVVTDGRDHPRGTAICRVELSPGEQRDVGDVALPRPARLLAVLRDADGRPVDAPLVAVQRAGAPSYEATWVQPDREGTLRPLALCGGAYELRTMVEGFAPVAMDVELVDGRDETVEITLERGVAQTFRIAFPHDPDARRGRGRVDVFIWDGEGPLLLDDRVDGDLDRDGRFSVTVQLVPGAYRARFVDHRRGVEDHGVAEVRFDVPTASPAPVDVNIDPR